jgi:hypothetical protein
VAKKSPPKVKKSRGKSKAAPVVEIPKGKRKVSRATGKKKAAPQDDVEMEDPVSEELMPEKEKDGSRGVEDEDQGKI